MAAAPFIAPSMLRAQDMSRLAIAPIHVRDARVWIPVRFGNSAETHQFIIDSGAFSHLMNEALARQLDLRRVGMLRGSGIGGPARLPAYRAPDVSVGEVRVGQMIFAAYQPPFLHPQAGGALSAAVMTVADTDLDFDAGLWRLHLDGRSDRAGFELLPSTIRSEGPGHGAPEILVDMDIDGERYRLKADTGAPGEILLHPSGTRRSRLWNAATPFSPTRISGIGGDGGKARIVRVSRASLGGIAFERPLITLGDPEERQHSEWDGLLGIGLLHRLNLSTEVRARRLWAKRNAQPPRPERYGMSGLWLEARRDGVEIVELSPASPAAEAGLRIGDRLVDGSLQEWIRRLAGRPGTRIEIPMRRGEEARTVTLTLREYL